MLHVLFPWKWVLLWRGMLIARLPSHRCSVLLPLPVDILIKCWHQVVIKSGTSSKHVCRWQCPCFEYEAWALAQKSRLTPEWVPPQAAPLLLWKHRMHLMKCASSLKAQAAEVSYAHLVKLRQQVDHDNFPQGQNLHHNLKSTQYHHGLNFWPWILSIIKTK